jgi:hypothetical protein
MAASHLFFCKKQTFRYFRRPIYTDALLITKENAQMAESVDALVSNTSIFTDMPVRPRLWVQKQSESGE